MQRPLPDPSKKGLPLYADFIIVSELYHFDKWLYKIFMKKMLPANLFSMLVQIQCHSVLQNSNDLLYTLTAIEIIL